MPRNLTDTTDRNGTAHPPERASIRAKPQMMPASCNKIAVSTGTDEANVDDGIEIYDVNPDGSVDFGLALPG
jgi:hypothetical protein